MRMQPLVLVVVLAVAASFAFVGIQQAQSTSEPNSSVANYAEAAVLVEDNSAVISPPCRAVYVSTVGDVVVDMARTGTDITFPAVPAGTTIPVRIQRFKTASTATGLCLW